MRRGGKCPPIVFLEGANIHHYAFAEGAIILPCQLLGEQMSTHAIFHREADVRGGNVRLPQLHVDTVCQSHRLYLRKESNDFD